MATATHHTTITGAAGGNLVVSTDDEDGLLRRENGIIDEIVFPRLRAMGFAERDLHRAAMRYLRQVQAGRDADGAIADFLGVVRCGVNGTRAKK